jgi:cytochrome c oxidase assembly protein subunit 15
LPPFEQNEHEVASGLRPFRELTRNELLVASANNVWGVARRSLSPNSFHRLTQVALWSLVAIVITGAAVRLTGSGLGCSDWPNCEDGQLVPAADFHGWVEFANRLITGLVSIAVIAAVLGSLRLTPRRTDLIWASWGLVTGVVGQIVLGAITVRTHLSPPIVMAHFLLSMVLIANAVVLVHRSDPVALQARSAAAATLRILSRVIVGVASVAVFTGTIVTASGPHGGDEGVERLNFDLPNVARIHGATVVVLVCTTLLLLTMARRAPAANTDLSSGQSTMQSANELIERRTRTALLIMFAQAAIGYVQYFTDVPTALVAFHIAGATTMWITVVRLLLVSEDLAAMPTTSSTRPNRPDRVPS